MLATLGKPRHAVEISLLVALCLFLPLFEAPKNLAWLAYSLVWLVNRALSRDFGGRWDFWDSLVAAWIASGFLVAAFAGLHQSEWRGAADLLRYGSILWMAKRARYEARQIEWVFGALVLSALLGLGYGYWRLWTGAAKSGYLQLHSVGHVNHTAIYLAIMLGVCAAWIFASWRPWAWWRRAAGAAIGALILASLIYTKSRGAVGIGLLLLLALGLAWWPRSRAPLAAAAAVLALIIAVAAAVGLDVLRKHAKDVANDNMLSLRDGIWRMGLETWQRYPWFGVGMDNFAVVDLDMVRRWRVEAGKGYDPSRYVDYPHAHSLYLNTLAERGLAGFAALMAALIAWAAWLARFRPRAASPPLDWLLWGGAASAWFVTVGVGAVNTTLHHEHGILAVLLLGLWLSTLPARRAS